MQLQHELPALETTCRNVQGEKSIASGVQQHGPGDGSLKTSTQRAARQGVVYGAQPSGGSETI